MTGRDATRPGRSGLLLATVAAIAATMMTFGGCADDAPAPQAPATTQSGGGSGSQDTAGTGSEVGGGGSGVGDLTGGGGGAGNTVLPRNTSPGATDAPNPNAAGGGAGTATTAP